MLVRTLALGLLGLLAPTLTTVSAIADPAPVPAPPAQAWLRVGHFVPGMDTVSVELTPRDDASAPVVTDTAAYGDVSSYGRLAAGAYVVTVRQASAQADADPLLSRSLEVVDGEARTIAVVGTSTDPRLALLTDDLTLPAAGTARVRLLSASEQAGSATVRAVDGPVIAAGAVLGQASPYRTVPAGTWTLELEGEDPGTRLERVSVASGSVYTVVVLDAPAGGTELRVVTDAAGAVVAPRGGAKTGGQSGGQSGSQSGSDWWGRLVAALRSAVTTPAPPRAAPAGLPSGPPVSIAVPAIGVDAAMVDLGIATDGSIEVPSDPDRVGWLDTTPVPGEQGPAVLAGHVDSTSGPAVFQRLATLRPGDEIRVTRDDGTTVAFTVDVVRSYPQDRFPTAQVYGPVPGPALRLITCGGDYRAADGGYQANVVVFAS